MDFCPLKYYSHLHQIWIVIRKHRCCIRTHCNQHESFQDITRIDTESGQKSERANKSPGIETPEYALTVAALQLVATNYFQILLTCLQVMNLKSKR